MGASMGEHVGQADRPVEDMSYTEASAELDEIVGFFEGRDVDVDQLVGRLVRATAIIEELDKRLRRTRVQVEQLVPRLAAVLEEEPGGEVESAELDDEPSPASAHIGGSFGEGADELTPADEVAAVRATSRTRSEEDDDDAPGLF